MVRRGKRNASASNAAVCAMHGMPSGWGSSGVETSQRRLRRDECAQRCTALSLSLALAWSAHLLRELHAAPRHRDAQSCRKCRSAAHDAPDTAPAPGVAAHVTARGAHLRGFGGRLTHMNSSRTAVLVAVAWDTRPRFSVSANGNQSITC
eukprot:358723-Chlamydomonas_euryale.AAC.5